MVYELATNTRYLYEYEYVYNLYLGQVWVFNGYDLSHQVWV